MRRRGCESGPGQCRARPPLQDAARAAGERLREAGHEYGVTTGRPRRCGWYDAPAAPYDVNGSVHRDLPASQSDIHHARPVYECLPGARISVVGVGAGRDAVVQRHSLIP